MAETQTPNYKWVKPDIGGDASNWGNVLNTLFDNVDSVVYANQQAGVAIGSGALWFTATAPTNWLLCQGQSLDTTVYAALFAVIGYAFGGSGANFNLPNFTDIFPIGASATRALAATGGAATVTLDATMIPNHTHTATSTQPAHTHTASQGTHNHPDPTHTHGVNDPTHTHTYATLGGGVNLQAGSGGNINATVNTGAAATGVSIAAAGTGIQPASAGAITVSTGSAGAITTTVAASTGGGKAHDNMPPWLGVNFIIRYQ